MAKKDNELYGRLRHLGLRKQAASALSEVSQSAGKKAQRAAVPPCTSSEHSLTKSNGAPALRRV